MFVDSTQKHSRCQLKQSTTMPQSTVHSVVLYRVFTHIAGPSTPNNIATTTPGNLQMSLLTALSTSPPTFKPHTANLAPWIASTPYRTGNASPCNRASHGENTSMSSLRRGNIQTTLLEPVNPTSFYSFLLFRFVLFVFVFSSFVSFRFSIS